MKHHQKKTMWDVKASFLIQEEAEMERMTQKYITEDWENAGVFGRHE
jgi:hypothetical protein